MSLAFTMPEKANMYAWMHEKLWFEYSDHTAEWDAWVLANPSVDQAKIDKFSGATLTVMVSNAFIKGFPMDPTQTDQYQYVTKWSGGCLRDESSGMGGFCLLEHNDTDLSTLTPAESIYYDTGASADSQYVQNNVNRSMQIYRLTGDEFDTTFETAWEDQAATETETGNLEQDGRCFRNSI